MREGASEVALAGPPSDHDLQADRLEAFARPGLLAALWMQSLQHAAEPETLAWAGRVAGWFRQALVRGTTPGDPAYWGPNANYHQNGVEMGLFVIALEVARDWLWNPLTPAQQEQVARWMASNRGTGHHWNNHFFFGVFALEFLESVGQGRPADRAAIAHWMDEMELMYRGQGWFMDGMNQSYDHYNAYAFHFYGPLWIHLYGHRDPPRVERWKGWSRAFLESYQHSFAPSGEHPAFGRSITYRFNATAPFAAGQLVGSNPLTPGRTQRLCRRNLEFFLERPIYQEQGALGIGWTDVFPEVAEAYSCAGSVYWCAKAFVSLLIPPADPFWNDPEEPLLSEETDYAHVVKSAGLVLRKVEDAVEILNAGSEICATNRDKFGPYKWGKVAYRTGFAFTLGDRSEYSSDLGLTARDPRDGRTFGRHYTVPLEVTDAYYLSSYNLGDRDLQCNLAVESLVAWKGPWILQVHQYFPHQAMDLKLGGYALPVADGTEVSETTNPGWVDVRCGTRLVALQPVGAAGVLKVEGRSDASTPRRHLAAPLHRTPVLLGSAEPFTPGVIAALCLATDEAEGPARENWKVESLDAGRWVLRHPTLGQWVLEHSWLPCLAAES